MSEHDPIDRASPGEPHFTLLARDPTASELVTLWAVLRKRDGSLVDAVVARLKDKMLALPIQPHKDNTHFWSAQQVATAMDIWTKDREMEARSGLTANTEAIP